MIDVNLGTCSDVTGLWHIVIVEIHLCEIFRSRIELLVVHLLVLVENSLAVQIGSVRGGMEKGSTKLAHTLLLSVHSFRIRSLVLLIVAVLGTS